MTLEAFKAWVRPATSAAGGFATCVALFVPQVTADKMAITAALAGCYVFARMAEKKVGKA